MSRMSYDSRSDSVLSRKSVERVVETHDDLRKRSRGGGIAPPKPQSRSNYLKNNAGVQTSRSGENPTQSPTGEPRITRSALVRKVQRDHERSKKAYREKNYDEMFKSDDEDDLMRQYLDTELSDSKIPNLNRPNTKDMAINTGLEADATGDAKRRPESHSKSGGNSQRSTVEQTNPDLVVEEYLNSFLVKKKQMNLD